MIPIIYEKDETNFVSNGLGRLRDCISCIVTEERNGVYECDFEYPITGANYDLIQLGRIIGVTHDDTGDIQPFDIVSYEKPIEGIVTFHAVHISYRLSFQTVWSSSINSLAAAFTLFGNVTGTPFIYWTDKTSSGYLAAADGIPRSVRQMLGGIEGSVLDAYGGEYEFDKWIVKLWASRGETRDFSIRYGVNMIDFNDETDISDNWSACVPYWTDGVDKVIGSRQTSGSSTITGRGETVPLDLSDKFEDKPTNAQVEAAARSYMSTNQPFLPAQTIEVSFIRLQDMSEYDEFDNLLRCSLCDTINVIFPDYSTQGKYKIVKTVWDVLSGRYEEMELGKLSTTLAEALGISESTDKAADILSGNVTIGGDLIVNGTITSDGHSSQIGWRNFGGDTKNNVASGTTLVQISNDEISLDPGRWLLIGEAQFPASTTGIRELAWYSGTTLLNASYITTPGTSGQPTRLQSCVTVLLTASTTMNLYAAQNSGSARNITYYWQVIRIA